MFLGFLWVQESDGRRFHRWARKYSPRFLDYAKLYYIYTIATIIVTGIGKGSISHDFLHKIYMGVAELFCVLIRAMAVLFLSTNSTRPSLVASRLYCLFPVPICSAKQRQVGGDYQGRIQDCYNRVSISKKLHVGIYWYYITLISWQYHINTCVNLTHTLGKATLRVK